MPRFRSPALVRYISAIESVRVNLQNAKPMDAAKTTGLAFRPPKTILGFCAIIMAIVSSGTVIGIGILSRYEALHHLIAAILIFTGSVTVAVLVAVFVTGWKDPTILMLGEVSPEAYIANRKLTLGDSASGEFTDEILAVIDGAKTSANSGIAETAEQS